MTGGGSPLLTVTAAEGALMLRRKGTRRVFCRKPICEL